MKFDYKNIDFLVLLPCPMKAAFGIIANQISIEYTARSGNRVNFLPVSGIFIRTHGEYETIIVVGRNLAAHLREDAHRVSPTASAAFQS